MLMPTKFQLDCDQHARPGSEQCACAGTESGSSGLPVQSFHIAPPASISAVFRPPLLDSSIIPGGTQQTDPPAARQGQSSDPGSPSRMGRLRLSLPRLSSQRSVPAMIPMRLDISGSNLEDVTSLAVGSQQQSFAAHIASRTWQTAAGQQHVEQVTPASSVLQEAVLLSAFEPPSCKLTMTWSSKYQNQRSDSTSAKPFVVISHTA